MTVTTSPPSPPTPPGGSRPGSDRGRPPVVVAALVAVGGLVLAAIAVVAGLSGGPSPDEDAAGSEWRGTVLAEARDRLGRSQHEDRLRLFGQTAARDQADQLRFGDQAIDRAQGQGIHELLKEILHAPPRLGCIDINPIVRPGASGGDQRFSALPSRSSKTSSSSITVT